MNLQNAEHGLIFPAQGTGFGGTFHNDELQKATQKLHALLAKRVSCYTMGDHSSVPVETAEELLRSIAFTLAQADCTGRALIDADLDEAFRRGQDALKRKLAATKRLYFTVRMGTPHYASRALKDTLKSIGGFFDRYDADFFAHDVPCDVDYQLCRPDGEGLQGVAYVEAYLLGLKNEHAILSCFAPEVVTCLLAICYRDYSEMINNLCEPVVVNALGCALLNRDAHTLLLTAAEQMSLVKSLAPMHPAELQRTLSCAAEILCKQLDIRDAGTGALIAWTAQALCPRIQSALPTRSLDGIFLA